jgi:hypothetical protein
MVRIDRLRAVVLWHRTGMYVFASIRFGKVALIARAGTLPREINVVKEIFLNLSGIRRWTSLTVSSWSFNE